MNIHFYLILIVNLPTLNKKTKQIHSFSNHTVDFRSLPPLQHGNKNNRLFAFFFIAYRFTPTDCLIPFFCERPYPIGFGAKAVDPRRLFPLKRIRMV